MKPHYILPLAALSLCLASCYEIDDLEQYYRDQYKPAEFSAIDFATNYVDQITFMRLQFDVQHYKDGCKLMLHYTDVDGADPFVIGDSIDISSELDNPYSQSQYGIYYELRNLMPETRYWVGLSYRDPGCETLRSKVVDFRTEGIEKRCDCYDYDPYHMVVTPKFERVPAGGSYGCLIGTDANLTLEHCLSSREVGSSPIGDSERSFREVFADLIPGATYYYRAYVTYRGCTYYSRCYEQTLPEVLVAIFHCQAELIAGGVLATAYYVDNILIRDVCDSWEHGFLLSASPDATYEASTRYPAQPTDNLMSAQISGLQPGQTYYLTAYTRYDDQLVLSDQVEFTVPE